MRASVPRCARSQQVTSVSGASKVESAREMKFAREYFAISGYAIIMVAVWFITRHSSLAGDLGPQLPYVFVSFALLLAPLWFFAFGFGDWLLNWLAAGFERTAGAALLGVPYLVFALPSGNFRWPMAIAMFGLPIVLAAVLEYSPRSRNAEISDALVLITLVSVYMLHLLTPAWPYSSLAVLPKLFIADIALYLYVVVRKLEGIGYSFAQPGKAAGAGMREWAYFFPIAIGLGFTLGFIHFHAHFPTAENAFAAVLLTFLLVALPEELFFRGIVQNLLESRIGRGAALLVAAVLFGLAHFNKGAAFNWRYVALASIAGVFYGRAWRTNRQLLASVITHTAVDVIWLLWFK